jgi:radical SAM family uncharacterized protein
VNWDLIAGLKKILAMETGTQIYAPGLRTPVAFMYPNTYSIGMSNLGLHILYQIINGMQWSACERFFLPSKQETILHKKSNTPLLSLETQRPLNIFPFICVMMSFEMDYVNFLAMLEMGKVTLYAAERKEKEPLVIMGGPCATFNPEPLTFFVDIFVIGEGEETLTKLLNTLMEVKAKGASRVEQLEAAAQIPGVYVPCFYKEVATVRDGVATYAPMEHDAKVPATVQRQWVKEIDKYPHASAIVTEHTEFAGMYIVEVARGCGRHCRFCMAGYCFRKPRNRDLKFLLKEIAHRPSVTKKVGLMGAAVSDYPEMAELTQELLKENISFSLASLRADTLTIELAQALAHSGQKTMTIAPEAGNKRMRAAINKGITEEHVFNAVRLAAQAGMRNIKLYFMIGLPGETDEDITAIIDMVQAVRKLMTEQGNKGELVVSVNAFVPKPFTPYQWGKLEEIKILKHRFSMLKENFKKDTKIKLITESLKETEVQAILARGDRLVGQALGQAFTQNIPLKQAMAAAGLTSEKYAHRVFTPGQVLPWSHLDMGVTDAYMQQELKKSEKGEPTIMCFPNCHRCGVCK